MHGCCVAASLRSGERARRTFFQASMLNGASLAVGVAGLRSDSSATLKMIAALPRPLLRQRFVRDPTAHVGIVAKPIQNQSQEKTCL
jgi:hypothetical protein